MSTPNRKRPSNQKEDVIETPRKKSNTDNSDFLKMVQRLQSKDYFDLQNEMKYKVNKPWDYEFRYKVYKNFFYILHEGGEISSQYLNLIQENESLRKRLEDKTAEVAVSEASKKTLQSEIETCKATINRQKEEIKEHEMENSKLSTEIKKVLLDNMEKYKEIQEEKDKRELAEKAAKEAEATLESQTTESLPQNNLSEITEKLDGLKDEVNKLQNLTADDVVQGIKSLTTNVSNMFPAKKEGGPSWIVPQGICQSIFDSAQENANAFIPLYLAELFHPAELILPTKELKKSKKEEFEAVFLHFFKLFSGDLSEKLFNQELETLRNKRRAALYKAMGKHETVGVTLSGHCIFYVYDPLSGKMMPYRNAADAGSALTVKGFANNYGIPFENQEDEFMLIVEKSNGIVYRRVSPSSGYVQMVYSHGKGKKC